MVGAATAKKDRFADLMRFLDSEMAGGSFPGYAVTASLKGRIALRRAGGTYYRLGDPGRPMKFSVIHPFYSFSKLVSSTAIGMAVGDGLVDWDTPVRTWIPEFAGGGKDGITIRQLLTHSAGIPNPPGIGSVRTKAEWDAAVKAVCAAKTEWEPGSRTFYHALSGQLIAAEAVLRRSGSPSWDDYCLKKLFGPLGARSLRFAVPPDNLEIAITPQPAEPPKTHFDALSLSGHPAGGCLGSPTDALKVLQLHLNGGKWNGRQLLPEAVFREMHTVQYRHEIEAARRAGRQPDHEPWGLGPLLRGDGPSAPSHPWFGFANQASPGVFGHAGIDTVIGIADMNSGIALFFVTTNSPKTPEKTVEIRNGVTDRIFAALSKK